jgi:hypothetical protein
MLNWPATVDDRLRSWAQTGMNFLGRRYGVTRRGVMRNCGIGVVIAAPLALWGSAGDAPIFTSFFAILILVSNLFLVAIIYLRANAVLGQSEQWGSYSMWEEWRWLRRVEIFLYPPSFIIMCLELTTADLGNVASVMRSTCLLAMLYAITVNKPPPRARKAATAPARSHVGVH